MAGFGDIFSKGSTAEQFLIWGVLQQLLQPLLAPFTVELSKLVNSATPDVPLSANVAAALVSRHLIDFGTGQDIANDNGIGENDFRKLVSAALTTPEMSAVLEAYNRGLISKGSDDPTAPSLFGAFTDAGIRPEWNTILEQLATQIPTVAEVMNAWLTGQIGREEALKRYLAAGGDPTWFQTSYNANGEAPTPSQALELLNRGIIPEHGTGPSSVSYEQAFLEGPWRNKWLGPFLALREYLPPPRTVTAMYHDGQIDHALAAQLLVKQGLSAQLAEAYLAPVKHTTTQTEHHLAKTDILTLYTDHLMSRADAVKGLRGLKYTAADANLLLDLADVRAKAAMLRSGVGRLRTLFEGGKLDRAQALTALEQLGVPRTEAQQSVDEWSVLATHKVRELTPAQVESAVYDDLISEAEGMARLIGLGYDEADAWLALSVRLKAPLRTIPRPAALGPAPTRGA